MTRVTVWIALAGYAAGLILFLLSRGRPRQDNAARIFWTVGCIGLLAHIASAYHYYHGWSHTSAYAETARQTEQVYGLYWGGGLFINYVLMIGWIADVIWWWRGIKIYRHRAKIFSVTWHVFLFFIFFNATVVFEGGFLRWLGLLFTATIIFVWVYTTMKHSDQRSAEKPAG